MSTPLPHFAQIFVGFGFGAIQAGLFLYEAWRSGNFTRLVVAEVLQDVVDAVRANSGLYTLNIAHADHVQTVQVGPIEIYNPAVEADRAALIDALVAAHEIATAVPTVNFYQSDSSGSIHRLLAEAAQRKLAGEGPQAAIYTAENNNHAAEILQKAVLSLLTSAEQSAVLERICFVNTVITKMCGIVRATDSQPAIAPGLERAFLVEAFCNIQISQIQFTESLQSVLASADSFQRGLTLFTERVDLLPFEESKLFGINGIHAIAAYLGLARGLESMSQLTDHPDLMAFLYAAASQEIAPALAHKYAKLDPFFNSETLQAYINDYIERMVNPFLQDSLERVGRDPARKLSWNDRLIGAMRLILRAGISPRRYAIGAAAALRTLSANISATVDFFDPHVLAALWQTETTDNALIGELLQKINNGWNELMNMPT